MDIHNKRKLQNGPRIAPPLLEYLSLVHKLAPEDMPSVSCFDLFLDEDNKRQTAANAAILPPKGDGKTRPTPISRVQDS